MQPNAIEIARGRWLDILGRAGIGEEFLKNRHGPCPLCGGKDRFRFDDLDGRGSWFCNNCGAGDGFRLLMEVQGVDFKEAARFVREIAPSIPAAKGKPMNAPHDRIVLARRLWHEAEPIKAGDAVDQYLRGRNIPILDCWGPPNDIRTHGGVIYYEDGKPVGTYPAMLALVRNYEGSPVTVHCTYLYGGKKAPVKSPKKVLSKIGGSGIVRLYESIDGEILLCEGIETAMRVTIDVGMSAWSCLSAGGLEKFVCPPEITTIGIWGDNDANFVGQSAAYALAKQLTNEGKSISVHIPDKTGTDWANIK